MTALTTAAQIRDLALTLDPQTGDGSWETRQSMREQMLGIGTQGAMCGAAIDLFLRAQATEGWTVSLHFDSPVTGSATISKGDFSATFHSGTPALSMLAAMRFA